MERKDTANAKIEKCVLAEVLQTPKWEKALLQKFCKRQNEEKRPCRSSANTKIEKSVLAGVLQTPKWGKALLQKRCKAQKLLRSVCGSPASLLVWRKPKKGSGKNDRVLGDKCIGSNGFASAKKRQSVGIDEDGA